MAIIENDAGLNSFCSNLFSSYFVCELTVNTGQSDTIKTVPQVCSIHKNQKPVSYKETHQLKLLVKTCMSAYKKPTVSVDLKVLHRCLSFAQLLKNNLLSLIHV